MLHKEFESPETLRDTIKCFWYTCNDFGDQNAGFEVVPDGYAEITFHFGGNLSNISPNGDLQLLASPIMVGLLNHPLIFHVKGKLEVIGIRCYPWTVFDLLGLPSGNGGVQQFEHPLAKLHPVLAQLMAAGKPEEAINILKDYFLNADKETTADNTLFKAGTAMTKAKGSIAVSEVAEAAHATVRTLERKFKQAAGHTVKDVAGLMRFEQVRNRLWADPKVNLAALSHELGYTDQAHLSREFKRYSGTTPAAFARKAKERHKNFNSEIVAFVQS
ncbi:AraC family transcriptional regulator [Mucilaginibacter conchicola]|uniref:AraC family transcriptional regulator n=1 Tax=Mucilaginibacter conchicola TaxID=2303333 RepID=A0A372NQW4_9SPHI|nr:helix-turn-helix domain-containing protein [Mucilaginibacter conchicola]RFZ90997.1 AraC family transcriptional regulator [Mucilaginibacter conchicola]